MNPENSQPESSFKHQAEKFADLKTRMEATHQKVAERVKAAENGLPISETKYETPAILMSQARTKAHKDFEHIEDVLQRGEAINRRKAEINNHEIVPDDGPFPNLSREDGKEEITVSGFKRKFLE